MGGGLSDKRNETLHVIFLLALRFIHTYIVRVEIGNCLYENIMCAVW